MAVRKTIRTNEVTNMDTGQVVIHEEVFVTRVKDKEQFIRAYIQDIGALAKCSGAEQGFMLCCLKYLEFNTNSFMLNKERRAEICECSGTKLNTANAALTRLVKKNILIRKCENTYLMNPKIFFFGNDLDRNTIIKATLTYIIGE